MLDVLFPTFMSPVVNTVKEESRVNWCRGQGVPTPAVRQDCQFSSIWTSPLVRMTADPRTACGQVTQQVKQEPEPVLRSLNRWGNPSAELLPDDVCRIPD